MDFKLTAPFKPTGDQPQAIEQLVAGVERKLKAQVLLGVTGSGKTFTMANCIARLSRPTLVISHNKTLAAQLYQEFRDFFPENAVSYFVSYYDYYQPEAYIPQTDTYIEKETDINEEIDKLRLAATTNLLTRPDTIIVASVSCIYNIGSPREYGNFILDLRTGLVISRQSIISRLAELQYERSQYGFHRATFRVHGELIDIFPAYEETAIRVEHDGEKIVKLKKLNPIDGSVLNDLKSAVVYPAKHYLANRRDLPNVFSQIRHDLAKRVACLKRHGKLLEAERLSKRVNYDLEMIAELGYVNGIENYSRYFDGRQPGEPPYTLLDYFEEAVKRHPSLESASDHSSWLLFIDESHMTVPQIRGMYHGDRSRKQTLIDFGFRLPAALDNRPLTFDEFIKRTPQTIFVSATPGEWEISVANKEAKRVSKVKGQMSKIQTGVVEQLIRPTGLVDPKVIVRKTQGQIADLVLEILKRKMCGERVLVTTLTKRMAEDLADYLASSENIRKLLKGQMHRLGDTWSNPTMPQLPKVHYLHSDIATLKRSDILDDFRRGVYDVVIGINLLREGLDLPEVSLVAILDADKEGFLRSETSLIQTMGRAARHVSGQVIMYADTYTNSMKRAIAEVNRRRQIQLEYNKKNKITPKTIKKRIRGKLVEQTKLRSQHPLLKAIMAQMMTKGLEKQSLDQLLPDERKEAIRKLKYLMNQAAKDLNFELAAQIRDQIDMLQAFDN